MEHSRVFYFRLGEEEKLYLASADWMSRNMFRRIELAWPVTDPMLLRKIVDDCLSTYLQDTQDAWNLQADGSYTHSPQPQGISAQKLLMKRYNESRAGE